MVVSVVIPTYNRASYLGQAIDSVLSQSTSGLQLIVVDDGSTDDTSDVLRRYEGKIDVIRQRNAGVSAARNEGIRQAKGDWVAFLDSDDRWKPGKLSVQLEDLEGSDAVAHVLNTMVFRDFAYDRDLFQLQGLSVAPGSTVRLQRPLAAMLAHNFARVQSTLVRRDVFKRTGLFNESYTILEDMDLLCRVALEGPWLVRNAILVEEIRRDEPPIGLGLQRLHNTERTCRTAISVLLDILADGRLDAREVVHARSELAKNYRWLATLLRADGRRAEARTAALQSLRCRITARGVARLLSTWVGGRRKWPPCERT